MPLDFTTLEILRSHHPAWRLLRSDHAPLIVSFLHRVFVMPNVRSIGAGNLAEALEDELYALRQALGGDAFPKPALGYLDDWAGADKGWLRKFYRAGTDEPYFDLTPATEKAIAWLGQLSERSFVGTESRLLTVIELLRQMGEGSETDPAARLADLRRRRDEIEAEIARVEEGDIRLLDDTALKDRFQQFAQTARELLADFREVEHNFRQLDRKVRERIALWDGAKGALLDEVMGDRDAIADSDQGRSFRAFWDFLMSSRRQEELTALLARVLALPPIAASRPDSRMARVHYDWLEAGEQAQRTVAALSQQLRRFLDDQAWIENRRIMDLLRGIEAKALDLRETPPPGDVMPIAKPAAEIDLPMERPLHTPVTRPLITDDVLDEIEEDIDPSALYDQVYVDRARLSQHIRQSLQARAQVTLRELVDEAPLRLGLAELVVYLQIGSESFGAIADEATIESIAWLAEAPDGRVTRRRAILPRIIFVRPQ